MGETSPKTFTSSTTSQLCPKMRLCHLNFAKASPSDSEALFCQRDGFDLIHAILLGFAVAKGPDNTSLGKDSCQIRTAPRKRVSVS